MNKKLLQYSGQFLGIEIIVFNCPVPTKYSTSGWGDIKCLWAITVYERLLMNKIEHGNPTSIISFAFRERLKKE